MKLFVKFTLIAMTAMFLLTACEITVEDDIDEEDNMSTEISDNPVTGSLAAGEDFVLNSALVQSATLFGDAGYDFKLFSTDQNCESGGIPNAPREIDFFVNSDTPLEVKEYNGLGPYIRNSSFFGCTVIFTSITDSTIIGKVKGGNPDGDQWVEGSFTAILCN